MPNTPSGAQRPFFDAAHVGQTPRVSDGADTAGDAPSAQELIERELVRPFIDVFVRIAVEVHDVDSVQPDYGVPFSYEPLT